MSEPTGGLTTLPKLYRSSCKGMFSVCVSPGLHLVEWTRHIVDLSHGAFMSSLGGKYITRLFKYITENLLGFTEYLDLK